MAKPKNDISLRNDEVQDIMSKAPGRIIRYGITVVFGMILLVIFLTWLIKYPEIITGHITLTTAVEPVKLVAQASGHIRRLFVRDGQEVAAGEVIAEIENPVPEGAVKYLREYLMALDGAMRNGTNEAPLPDTSGIILGDLQATVNVLLKELLTYNMNVKFRMDDAEIRALEQRIVNQKAMMQINKNVTAIQQKELENAKIKLEADKKLYKDTYLSKAEFFQSESAYRAKELQLEQLSQQFVDNNNALINLELQHNQAVFAKYSKNRSNTESIRGFTETIRSYIYGWQQKYTITAIRAGKINYLQRVQQGQYLKGGEELFAITQADGSYIGVIKVPLSGFGKVAVGQKAHVLLQNFPYQEYGMLEGRVNAIAQFPNTNEYRVEITLPNGMMTSDHKLLKFSPEMTGEAEIITEDKRIFDRVFESMLKSFKKM